MLMSMSVLQLQPHALTFQRMYGQLGDKTIDHGEDGSDSDVDDVEYKGKGHRLKRVRSLSSSEQDEASLLLVNASKHAKKRQGKEYHLNEGSSVA